MDALVAVVGSLLGVALGAGLTGWSARQAVIRQAFLAAIVDVAHLPATTTICKTAYVDCEPDAEWLRRLQEVMIEEPQNAILKVRRSLAAVVPYSRAAAALVKDSDELQRQDVADRAIAQLRRNLASARWRGLTRQT